MHLNFELHMFDTNSVGPVSDVEIKIRWQISFLIAKSQIECAVSKSD